MQRVCFRQTISVFNHILQPSQALALFYQSLIFSLKNLTLIKWISLHIDIPNGLQLLMIDIRGNVTIDEKFFCQQFQNSKHDLNQGKQPTTILKWLSRLILRLITDHSISSKWNRSIELENLTEFLKQFHTACADDLSILSNKENDEDDDLDEEDILPRAIYRSLNKCTDYIRTNTCNHFNPSEIQDFENNSIALYNQQILQILCSDIIELEIELSRQSRQSSFDLSSESSTVDEILQNYHSVWANLWKNVMREYLQYNHRKSLREVSSESSLVGNDFSIIDVKRCNHRENQESSSDDDYEIISSPPTDPALSNAWPSGSHSIEDLVRLMKDSSDVLSLTYDEFCHIRNVLTRAELETLLFDEKLYNEVAQSKLCFTCRKVHFNLLTFTFGIHCNVCKQKVCRNCATQIAVPKDRSNHLPIQSFTPLTLTKPFLNSDKCHSLDTQTPSTPTMNDLNESSNLEESESRRCSTPGNSAKQWQTETIDICTDCFFLLQQIRKKSRQRHISPAPPKSNLASSSSFNRSRQSSSRSTSNYNLSSSSSASSLAAILVQQQQQRSLMARATSMHANLKPTKSAQELSLNHDPLQTLATLALAVAPPSSPSRVSLSRRHLFLQLQPTYDMKLNNVKTE